MFEIAAVAPSPPGSSWSFCSLVTAVVVDSSDDPSQPPPAESEPARTGGASSSDRDVDSGEAARQKLCGEIDDAPTEYQKAQRQEQASGVCP